MSGEHPAERRRQLFIGAFGELILATAGVQDSGHRVCDAILNPDSELGKRIRGRP